MPASRTGGELETRSDSLITSDYDYDDYVINVTSQIDVNFASGECHLAYICH